MNLVFVGGEHVGRGLRQRRMDMWLKVRFIVTGTREVVSEGLVEYDVGTSC